MEESMKYEELPSLKKSVSVKLSLSRLVQNWYKLNPFYCENASTEVDWHTYNRVNEGLNKILKDTADHMRKRLPNTTGIMIWSRIINK